MTSSITIAYQAGQKAAHIWFSERREVGNPYRRDTSATSCYSAFKNGFGDEWAALQRLIKA